MSVKLFDLFDIYAYLAKVSGSRDAEIPLLSPINLRLEPGERMTINLKVNFRFSGEDGRIVPDYDDPFKNWPPRLIFTANGTIIFDFDSNSTLSIHNNTGCDFQIQRMGIITSLCNTRCMKVMVSHTYAFDSDDEINAPIMFGNAFVANEDGEGKGSISKRAKQRSTKEEGCSMPKEDEPTAEKKNGKKTERRKLRKSKRVADADLDEDNVKPRPLKIGTGCSGMDTPMFALKQMGVEVIHKFSADTCPKALKTIAANFSPEKLYKDMQEALDEDESERLDIFIAGIPCQPFSQCGKG